MPKIPSSLLDCDIFFPEVRIRKETEIGVPQSVFLNLLEVGTSGKYLKDVQNTF